MGSAEGKNDSPKPINNPPQSENLGEPFNVSIVSIASPERWKRPENKGKRDEEVNEDICTFNSESRTVIVGDGVGGKGDGRGYLASRLAQKVIIDSLKESDKTPSQDLKVIKDRLSKAISQAHHAVRQAKEAADNELRKIDANRTEFPEYASTVSIAREVTLPDGSKKLVWAHTGDSNIRVWRNGQLIKLTTAHSAHRAALESNDESIQITQTEFDEVEKLLETANRPGRPVWDLIVKGRNSARMSVIWQTYFARRSLIYSAVGLNEEIVIDSEVFDLEAGDIVVMCTDGVDDTLTSRVYDSVEKVDDTLKRNEMEEIIERNRDSVENIPSAIAEAVRQKCDNPNEVWSNNANFFGDNGRAKPDDMTLAVWKV